MEDGPSGRGADGVWTGGGDAAALLRELELAIDEARAMPRDSGAGPLARVGDVIEALAGAAAEMRLAYWGYPHPGSVGDNRLVIVADGVPRAVTGVRFELGRLIVETDDDRADGTGRWGGHGSFLVPP